MSYQYITQLGASTGSKTYLTRRHGDTSLFAVKIIPKKTTIENHEVQSRRRHIEVLWAMRKKGDPLFLHCIHTFQTLDSLCIVTPFVSGGDIEYLLQRQAFTTSQTRFYSAEICLALGHLHECGIVHRNLKMEHLLLGSDGHIVMSGFGCCISGMSSASTTSTFTGGGNFMPPEVLLDKPYGRAVDWWALGILIYQMAVRQSPFCGENTDQDDIYDAILSDKHPEFPAGLDDTVIGIISGLLQKNPEVRLGASEEDALPVMNHDYFREINWDDILHKRAVAPFVPPENDEGNLSNFRREYTVLSGGDLRLDNPDVCTKSDDVFADFEFQRQED